MTELEETSIPVFAVTAAVGAIVLLFVLFCNVAKKRSDGDKEPGILNAIENFTVMVKPAFSEASPILQLATLSYVTSVRDMD